MAVIYPYFLQTTLDVHENLQGQIPFLGGLKLKFEIAPPRSKKLCNKMKRQAVEF